MTVGTSPIRKDAVAKVTGKARYTDDFTMPGMLHAAYVRSTIAHGTVSRIDTSAARSMDGVEAVFTFEDVPDTLFATAGHPHSLDPDHVDVADRLLLTKHVRYHGDEVAIVVASSKLAAKEAARAVVVEYDELPVCVDAASALADEAPSIHADGNVIKSHEFIAGGDLNTAVDGADAVISGQYHTPVVQHCHMENHIAYAYMDDFEHIVVVTSTQIPHICRRVVGQALDMPWGNVRVIKPYIGGGFGNKQDVVLEPMVAFLTTRLDGRPIKLELDREECMTSTRTRHSAILDCRAAADEDGTLKAVDVAMTSNTGAYASHGHSIPSAGGAKSCNLYPRSVIRFSALTHYSNIPAAGAMRAYGSPQVIFGLECALEDIARKIGMDSVDFRIKNVARKMDINPLSNKPIRSAGIVECLEKGRELIQWDEKKRRFANQEGPVRRGLGVACFSYGSGTYPVCVEIAGCRLILNQDGSVHMQVGATEIGQGSDTAFAQMAADTLGISYDKVHVVTTQDTDVSPFDTGAYASRQTYVVAPAVKKAALELKTSVLEYVREMTGKETASLDIVDNNVVAANQPDCVIASLADVAIDAYYHKQRGGQLTADVSHKTRTNAPSFGCTFVDLEVDVPMCKIHIHQIFNVHDAGQIIHPLLAEGQVHGGMGMAVGMALFEELLVNPDNGRVLNNNLLDYKIPTFVDIPDLGCSFVETMEPTAAYGNKSLGEPPIISPGPAIRNAILDATGVAVNRMPMSPKVLFTHFHDAGLL